MVEFQIATLVAHAAAAIHGEFTVALSPAVSTLFIVYPKGEFFVLTVVTCTSFKHTFIGNLNISGVKSTLQVALNKLALPFRESPHWSRFSRSKGHTGQTDI
ncbi:hypothetical protein EVAR_52990_1 [Eumeta japonica]|uniref:Uncharacterized protein n=1 Tax=Eumeta variegata TaxID=151549 RepID=A0A4C1YJP3_EUMVA|nr:hypothetical protein EVAR_52990_1 [Eumeta japonica]